MAQVSPKVVSKPTPVAKPTAAPAEAKVKKEKKTRPAYPGIGNASPDIYPFPGTPLDYSFDSHAKLKKKDFKTASDFVIYRAQELEHKAGKLRKFAEELKTRGTGAGAVKRLEKMVDKVAQLRAQLAASGVDVAELLAKLSAPKA